MKRLIGFFVLCAVLFPLAALAADDVKKEPKRVLFINSYHRGYSSSDDVIEGMWEVFKNYLVKVEYFFMDTKRNGSEEVIQMQVENVLKRIEEYKPHVIIACDDAAAKYVVEPYFKNGPIPVVFCGVNWSAQAYGLPTENVTGMLEVLPIADSIETLRQYYPKMKKLVVLTEDSLSEQKSEEILQPLYRDLGLQVEYRLVKTYDEWRDAFVEANQIADVIFFPTNGAIEGWNEVYAKAFIEHNIKKPVFTCDDFMMGYCVFGMTKVAQEQGEWAARAVIDILYGKSPADIPMAQNTKTKGYINFGYANNVNFRPSEELIRQCEIIQYYPGIQKYK